MKITIMDGTVIENYATHQYSFVITQAIIMIML